ncbi:MAG: radical SAM protein, partial [Candidatus Omnitrophota bacterium]|nr:radical SAM protein [Candidatus Omnitrophota bacterium]
MKIKDAAKLAAEILTKEGPAGCVRLTRSYFNLTNEPIVMSTMPLMIQIEPTLHCNLECSMCVNPLMRRQKRHMSFKDFQKIIDDVPSLKKISLVGAGEGLLNPDLFDMIAYAKSRSISIGFATNAMLLDDSMCKRIIDSRVDWVNISVDSAEKDKYERIRKGASFSRLLENIERLVSAKGRKMAPDISIWFVIMKDNLNELSDVIALAGTLGIPKVSAQLEH